MRTRKVRVLPLSRNRPGGGCGFRDTKSLSHHFRKLFGISMRDYRAQTRAKIPPSQTFGFISQVLEVR